MRKQSPVSAFTVSDALDWGYPLRQRKRKDELDRFEVKRDRR